MNRVLRKRIFREWKANFARYLALMLLIAFGMYIVTAMVAGAQTVLTGTKVHGAQNNVEDGQFQVFLPLTEEQESEIEENGFTIEKMFSLDLSVEDGSTLRLMKVRNTIDRIELDEGALPAGLGQCVLEKRYAAEHDLHVGETFRVAGVTFTITGIGSVPDYDAPYENLSDMAVSSESFGLLFVTEEQYEQIKENTALTAEDYTYAFLLGEGNTASELKSLIQGFSFRYTDVTDPYFLETVNDAVGAALGSMLKDGISNLLTGLTGMDSGLDDEALEELFNLNNLCAFIERDDNIRIAAASGDVVINKLAGMAAGVIAMILFTYVISVFVIQQIQKESSVIGTLYALGAKRRNLICHYITLPVLVTFAGGLLGAILGMGPLGQDVMLADSYLYFSIPEFTRVYPVYLMVYSIIMPPVIAAIVNTLVIRKKLSGTVLSLMRTEAAARPARRWKRSHTSLRRQNGSSAGRFLYRFQFRQIIRELRTSVTVIFGMLLALLVLMLGLDCNVLCENIRTETVRDTLYEYMYTLKYPTEEVPEGGEACYAQSLSKEQFGYTIDVTVMGINADNPYFPGITTYESTTLITASTAAAQKYGLKTGDEFVLTDTANETEYRFTVAEIGEYAAGLMVFMDIDSMRELFGETENYYNCVLSDEPLDIEEGRLYSVTTKEEIVNSSGVFIDLMGGMVAMMTGIAVVIFCVVMYLMQGVMIDRASFGVSLVKVFGYRTKEVQKLYLDGNVYTVILGALIGIPLSKAAMDLLYPFLIANIASGMNLSFPWYYYPAIFAGILLVYALINRLLVRKLGRITPADVLKNRE